MRYLASNSRTSGFTLAELLVATTIITIVMTAVYTSFSSSVRVWRMGEQNFPAYQDARTALSIMTHEIQNIVPGSGHLFEGKHNEFTCFVIAQPMDVTEGEAARVLWVHYRIRQKRNEAGNELVREEAVVDGPLPLHFPDEGLAEDSGSDKIDLKRKRIFTIAEGVKDFELRYYWLAKPSEDMQMLAANPRLLEEGEEQVFVPQMKDEVPSRWGQPAGMEIAVTFSDPSSPQKETTFTTRAAFRGNRIEIPLEGEIMEGLGDEAV
jgi:prepilin-type N-terminal cleavage/methylation domain-containing protein